MFYLDREAVLAHLWIDKYLVQAVDRRCWNIFLDKLMQPLVAPPGSKDRRQAFNQDIVVFDPRLAIAETRICCPFGFTHHLEHVFPKLVRRRHMQDERQTIAILESKNPGRSRPVLAPRNMPGFEIASGVFTDKGDRSAQKRSFHVLAFPGKRPVH